MISPAKQAVLDALNAERYGPSAWWATSAPDHPDAILQRQLLLAEVDDEDEVVA